MTCICGDDHADNRITALHDLGEDVSAALRAATDYGWDSPEHAALEKRRARTEADYRAVCLSALGGRRACRRCDGTGRAPSRICWRCDGTGADPECPHGYELGPLGDGEGCPDCAATARAGYRGDDRDEETT